MSSDRRGPTPTVRRKDGRYLRFSHRFACYQYFNTEAGVWYNMHTCQTETIGVPYAQAHRHGRPYLREMDSYIPRRDST